jgi:hypothetical protein
MAVAAALFLAAAPSQSLAQGKPPVASADPAPIQLAETRWAGRAEWSDGEAKDWTLYFRADGVLIYGYEGQTFDNGRWRQRDMLVNFDTNDYFALYVGHVRGDVFSGEMFNIRGQRGTFSFQRR